MTTTDMPVDDWRPGPDLSSRFRTIRRWYSLEVLGLDRVMNQEQFAQWVGFGSKAWAAWESGRNEPNDLQSVAEQLHATINLDPHYLMDGIPCPNCGDVAGMTCFLCNPSVGGVHPDQLALQWAS